MELLIGLVLGLGTVVSARLSGLDRERGFFPILLMVIATYYILFAVMGNSSGAIMAEVVAAVIFAAIAKAGFKFTPWLVVAGLAGHGVFDLIHGMLITNPGVPAFWPVFCAAFDVVLAAALAMQLLNQRVAGRAANSDMAV
jgi:uncharacterized membrane protein